MRLLLGSLGVGDFEADDTPTANDNKLAEGSVTVTVTPTDMAGNAGTAVTGSFAYDGVAPEFSVAEFSLRKVKVTMSEAVWGTATAADFRVTDDGTALTPSSISLASAAGSAASIVTLTMGADIALDSTVTVQYAPGGGRYVADAAGNRAAAFSGQSVTARDISLGVISGDGYR